MKDCKRDKEGQADIHRRSHRGSPSSRAIQPTPTSPALGHCEAPFSLYNNGPLFAQVSRRMCLDVNLIPAGLYPEGSPTAAPRAPRLLSSCPAVPVGSLLLLWPYPTPTAASALSSPSPGVLTFMNLCFSKFISTGSVQHLLSICPVKNMLSLGLNLFFPSSL